ncbi:MAG TPA: hypothetical protein ENL20_07295, partial [Candidatus Cloacimonetes bacterium]|nr:hypothetical protein [Candidatus Cloacimonadota bacterium]
MFYIVPNPDWESDFKPKTVMEKRKMKKYLILDPILGTNKVQETNKAVCFTPILIFILFFFFNTISAETIATVNSYEITLEQLHEKMQDYEGDFDLSFFQIRDLALKDLINDQLIIIYAKQNGITVDENEVESYFINLLGNDPKLLTNGEFDYQKFKKLKKTKQV